jgi:hypothetical protein
VISIDVLPDDVLLAIFHSYVHEATKETCGRTLAKELVEGWQPLVHVCQRWRSVVFGSPRHLNLRLGCTPKTPARDLLDVWPALPLLIFGRGDYTTGSVDNILAVLERSDRICEIHLEGISSLHLEVISAAMQVPFPELTYLGLYSNHKSVFPYSFLGGPAPRLQSLAFQGISFPGLPRLLLCATNLVFLQLFDIPYIPPEAMVTALTALTCLQSLLLRSQSPVFRPDQPSRCPPPSTRSVLPVLTYIYFRGVSDYLDDIVACIDTPRLDDLSISFFIEIEFDTPQLIQFISRTPAFQAFKGARLFFKDGHARIELLSQTPGSRVLNFDILCGDVGWQMSTLGKVCSSCLPPLSMLEDLYISVRQDSGLLRPDDFENTLWLEILDRVASVMNLYLSGEAAPRIAPALEELVGARTMEVLPTLRNIFLEGLQPSGHIQEGIGQFVSSRQVAGHPIAVSHWENRGRF